MAVEFRFPHSGANGALSRGQARVSIFINVHLEWVHAVATSLHQRLGAGIACKGVGKLGIICNLFLGSNTALINALD